MITDTREKILKFVLDRGRVSANEIVEYLGISRQGLDLQLGKLMRVGKLAKTGRPPKVYYEIHLEKKVLEGEVIVQREKEFIEERYLFVSPLGEKLSGVVGFRAWCERIGQPLSKTAHEYVATQKRY